MRRREFLKLLLGTPLLAGGVTDPAWAVTGVPERTLVHLMCVGGADFRFLFAPHPSDTAYAARFWESRSALYNYSRTPYTDYAQAFADNYLSVTDGSPFGFGIHKAAPWLKAQYDAGNVAIVSNVLASESRRHDQAQLVMATGDLAASQYDLDRDGWGGRLMETMTEANVSAVTDNVSVFCSGTNPAQRHARVIHMRDSRNFALSTGDAGVWQERMARALKSYYAAKQIQSATLPMAWPYHKILQNEMVLRRFGDGVKTITDAYPLPEVVTALTANAKPLAKQWANIYDSYSAADLLKLRAISMEYGGWDTHRAQRIALETNFNALFGSDGGFAAFSAAVLPGALANTTFMITTEFGRQLHANGDAGTDHGTGNYQILVGPAVVGGVYGEMFPRREVDSGAASAPYDTHGSDIKGLTSFERVCAAACDWVHPGSGVAVFPRTAYNDLGQFPDGPPLEPGVDLSRLFA